MKAEEQQGSLGSSKPGWAGGFTPQHRQRERGHGEGDRSLCLVPGSPPPHDFPRSLVQAMCSRGSSPNPCLSPCPPKNPHQGLPRLPSEGLLGSSSVFLKGCKWQLSHPSPAQPPRLRCYSCPNAATQRPPRQRGCGLRSAPPGCS